MKPKENIEHQFKKIKDLLWHAIPGYSTLRGIVYSTNKFYIGNIGKNPVEDFFTLGASGFGMVFDLYKIEIYKQAFYKIMETLR